MELDIGAQIGVALDAHVPKWLKHYHDSRRRLDLLQYTLKLNGVGANGSTDSSGNLVLPLYQNSMLRPLVVSRIVVWADGYDPGNPYSSSTAWLGIFGNSSASGAPRDYAPYAQGAPILPNVADYSGINGLRFDRGDVITLKIVGGPASKNVTGLIYGFAEPIGSDYEL